ncbi:FIST C-terminal domain-containing protein [Vibrio sp. ZSDE26]|uniref:FIST C-terminal domain-containing protein n=1 Tax=Vibrio amylolyticus TaxID=2847292 RepID=A0A9X2BIG8_9VIBR|nr:FIST N-terminal domain-containing protein [Vibrio amylolyticus]MCK6265011.1 FIST C-terminal domain-containing protein [Vibrio amylolyticus]
MKFITHVTHNKNTRLAVQELSKALQKENLSSVICYYTQEHRPEDLQKEFSLSLPGVSLIGCSTCKGVMTDKGVHFGTVIGVLAICDNASNAYGSGLVHVTEDNNVEEATAQALEIALTKSDRKGELPGFIVLHSTPGTEERIIDAIDKTFHTQVPIIGGSAADNHIDGHWSIFTESDSTGSGLALQVFYPSQNVSAGLSAGYSPTEFKGKVTKCDNRELLEIDHQLAQDVYLEWISDHAGVDVPKHFVFELVTEFPLGRTVGEIYTNPYYKLSHPISISSNGGLLLFTDIAIGQEVTLMSGDRQKLIGRAGRILKETKRRIRSDNQIVGAICIICAGPMLYLKEDIHEVYKEISNELNGRPFICPFTYGEQGRFIDGENAHGNLMVSSALFHSTL